MLGDELRVVVASCEAPMRRRSEAVAHVDGVNVHNLVFKFPTRTLETVSAVSLPVAFNFRVSHSVLRHTTQHARHYFVYAERDLVMFESVSSSTRWRR